VEPDEKEGLGEKVAEQEGRVGQARLAKRGLAKLMFW